MIWMGRTNNQGYATVHHTYPKTVSLHRLAYAKANGMDIDDIPAGMLVRHGCDVRCCVSPDHLSLGPPHENIHDAIRRGRHAVAFSRVNGKMFCQNGHDLDVVGHTTPVMRRGYMARTCRQCDRNRKLAFHYRKTGRMELAEHCLRR